MNEREKMTLMDDSSLVGPEGITLYKMDALGAQADSHSSLKLKLFLFYASFQLWSSREYAHKYVDDIARAQQQARSDQLL